MALVTVQLVRCDGCRGMLRDTADGDAVTQDVNEAAIFLTIQAAANRASILGWRIWTSWKEDGTEYVSRVDCPQDRT